MLGGCYDYFQSETTNRLKTSDALDYHRSIDGESFSPNVGFIWQPIASQSFMFYSKSFAIWWACWCHVVSANTDVDAFDAKPQYNEQYEVGKK